MAFSIEEQRGLAEQIVALLKSLGDADARAAYAVCTNTVASQRISRFFYPPGFLGFSLHDVLVHLCPYLSRGMKIGLYGGQLVDESGSPKLSFNAELVADGDDVAMVDAPPPAQAQVAQACVDLLNRMADVDSVATQAFVCNRQPCNQAVYDHPTIVIDELGGAGRYVVGPLGILNGLCPDPRWRVAMDFGDMDVEGRACPFLGFRVIDLTATE